jgi:hypothetical protein
MREMSFEPLNKAAHAIRSTGCFKAGEALFFGRKRFGDFYEFHG